MEILYQDNHLIFINKPAGLLSQGDITGHDNVVDALKDFRKKQENKPGEAFIGLVHRLDRPVSGVMVLAKTSKAAQRLNEAWHSPEVRKIYRAVVPRSADLPECEWMSWNDTLIKDPQTNTVRVLRDDRLTKHGGDVKSAVLRVRRTRMDSRFAELEIELGTGRGHQIRVQLSSRGMPILGDRKYGSNQMILDLDNQPRIALHAFELSLPHPTRKETITVNAPLPIGWKFSDR